MLNGLIFILLNKYFALKILLHKFPFYYYKMGENTFVCIELANMTESLKYHFLAITLLSVLMVVHSNKSRAFFVSENLKHYLLDSNGIFKFSPNCQKKIIMHCLNVGFFNGALLRALTLGISVHWFSRRLIVNLMWSI